MTLSQLAKTLKNLPEKPGVYRFYGRDGVILYIGKAKNLKKRVNTYFQSSRPKNQRLTLMISQIEKIEFTVVKTEKESLILEANLIHQLQPKYNVLLKDDRSYLYVRFTNHPIPGVFLTRKKYDPNSHYFGPYTKRTGIFQTLRTLRTIFPFCQEKYPKNKPCSYVGIKQCDGICVGKETKKDYLEKLDQIKKVLSGKTEQVEIFIQNKIQDAIQIQNYELAALWRDRLKILKETVTDQKIVLPKEQDLDILALVIEENSDGFLIGSIFIQNIRAGKVINVNNFLLTGTKIEESELTQEEALKEVFNTFLQRFMSSYYNSQEGSEDVPVLIQTYYTKGSLNV
jgi:excinuclease ABC subunit C